MENRNLKKEKQRIQITLIKVARQSHIEQRKGYALKAYQLIRLVL